MPRGAIVKNGIVIKVFEAASDFDPNYGGKNIPFVPTETAQIGDTWDGTVFTAQSVTPTPELGALVQTLVDVSQKLQTVYQGLTAVKTG